MRAVNANQAVDGLLTQLNKALEKKLDAHILLIRAGMDFGLDDAIREEITGSVNRGSSKSLRERRRRDQQ